MLEKLYIKNYLLLKDIDIEFSPGYNIITGETGVGKSILINALGLILGERADYSIIGKSRDKMIIEGHLRTNNINKKTISSFLKKIEVDELNDGYVILRREIYSKGYARNFINDTPVNVNDMKALGEILVDIHSQNEHQSLLRKDIHIQLLDSYLSVRKGSSFKNEFSNYTLNYDKLINLIKEYEELLKKKNELENRRTFMDFQRKEISDVDPKKNEDDELENELRASENIEVIQQSLSVSYNDIYEDSGSVIERLTNAEKELSKIKDYNKDASDILNDIKDVLNVIKESGRQLGELINNLSFDPDRIEQVRERLHRLAFLKKKYGGSLDSVLELYENLEKDLSMLGSFDDTVASYEKQLKELKNVLFASATELSKKRKEGAKTLEKEIVDVLKKLGLESAEFKVNFEVFTNSIENMLTVKNKNNNVRLTSDGFDDIEFLIKVNKGSDLSSLRKTASGGEVSRIMLAIKAVLAEADNVGSLIFDEIDIGISGRIAQMSGRVMKKLSEFRQVISITHLAQIAALADEHFLVEKESSGNESVTRIRKLDKKEKVEAVAKLLSGEKVTDAAMKSAKELISEK